VYIFRQKNFSFWEEFSEILSQTHLGFRVKYLLFLWDFIETWILSTDFLKILRCLFHENPNSGCRVQCGCRDRQTDRQRCRSSQSCFANLGQLGLRWRWVVHGTPRPLYSRERDPVPILQEAGWAPGLVWTCAPPPPTGIRFPDRPTCTEWPAAFAIPDCGNVV
jgi:hypothetical protein